LCVGTLNGVGRIYQQTFIDSHAKVGFADLGERLLKLLLSALTRAADRWPGLCFSEFKLRNLSNVERSSIGNPRLRSRRWRGDPTLRF
jgi:hypothetical protein